jgi:hypothetical protein
MRPARFSIAHVLYNQCFCRGYLIRHCARNGSAARVFAFLLLQSICFLHKKDAECFAEHVCLGGFAVTWKPYLSTRPL